MGAFSTRDWTKRKLGMVSNLLSNCQYHLAEIGEKYEAPHPEIVANLELITASIEVVKDTVDKMQEGI